MEHKRSGNEFEAVIREDGTIAVPAGVRKLFGGKKLQVRLYSREDASLLARHDVTDEELDRIATVQWESREQVVKCLLSEGSLRNDQGFLRRVKGTRR